MDESNIRLALDVQCGKRLKKDLESAGFDVVAEAGVSEMDEQWICRALDAHANVFLSPDYDVPNFLDVVNSSAYWVKMPQKKKREKMFTFLLKKIKKIEKSIVKEDLQYAETQQIQ